MLDGVYMARLEGKIELILSRLELIGDHETRIRALERKVWAAAGVAGAVGAGLVQLTQK